MEKIMIPLLDYEQYQRMRRDRERSAAAAATVPTKNTPVHPAVGEMKNDHLAGQLRQLNMEANKRTNEQRNKVLASHSNIVPSMGHLQDVGQGQDSDDESGDEDQDGDEDGEEMAYLSALAPFLDEPKWRKKKSDIFGQVRKLVGHPAVTSKHSGISVDGTPVGHLALILHYICVNPKTKIRNAAVLNKFLKKEGLFQKIKRASANNNKKQTGKKKASNSNNTKKVVVSKPKQISSKVANKSKRSKKSSSLKMPAVSSPAINPAIYQYLK